MFITLRLSDRMVLRKEKDGRKTVNITSRFAIDDYVCHRVSGVCAVTSAVAQAVSDSTHRCQLSRTYSSTRWHARPRADVLYAARTCTVGMYVQITATSQVHARYVMVSLSCQHWVWVFTKADTQNLCSKYGLERLEWLIFCYQCFKTHSRYNSKQRKLPVVFFFFLFLFFFFYNTQNHNLRRHQSKYSFPCSLHHYFISLQNMSWGDFRLWRG